MIPSIARQSVIIKCNMGKSVLTGNYEFYYAAGLAAKLAEAAVDEDVKPQDLFDLITEQIRRLSPKDDREAHLFGMIGDYRPGGEYDAQMKELLLWGKNETELWQVVIPS